MNKLLCVAMLAALSLPALGQKTRDRNLDATRKHGATSTVLPHRMNSSPNGPKDTNSQLDKLEHQTANTVIQPAAKQPKVQPYKLPPEPKPAADNFYQPNAAPRSGMKNVPGSGNRSSRSGLINSHGK